MSKENFFKIVILTSLLYNIYVAHCLYNSKEIKTDNKIEGKPELPVKIAKSKRSRGKEISALQDKVKLLRDELRKKKMTDFEKMEENEPFDFYDDPSYSRLDKPESQSPKVEAQIIKLSERLDLFEKNFEPAYSYFKEFDTATLTEDEQQLFEKHLKQMEKIDMLKQEFAVSQSLKEKMQILDKVSTMMADGTKGSLVARKAGLSTLATKLGYKKEDTALFIKHIQYIYESTSWGINLYGELEKGNVK